MMRKAVLTLLALACLLLGFENLEATAGNEDRVLVVAQNMEAAFKKLEDYTCDVEQIFFQDGHDRLAAVGGQSPGSAGDRAVHGLGGPEEVEGQDEAHGQHAGE